MSKFTKKSWFIGFDISKDTFNAALLHDQTPESFKENEFTNSLNGFESMLQWLSYQKIVLSESLFCMEHTGNYGLLLFAWLSQKEIDFCVEPGLEIKQSLGMIRGKNDPVDARRIATYAFIKKMKLKPFILPAKILIQIKQLLTYRDQLVRIRTSLKNSLKSHQQYQQVSDLQFVVQDIQQQLEQQAERIGQVEKQIKEIIESEEGLKGNFTLATSVKGIGFVIAAFMLVTTNNFTSFDNGRKYACYIGTAPFGSTSGTSIKAKPRVSHLANKRMKTLFSNGANSAKSWDPEIKAYYKRKREEGKEHKLIINAISCKLVNRVFAVVNRKTPYVTVYGNNFA